MEIGVWVAVGEAGERRDLSLWFRVVLTLSQATILQPQLREQLCPGPLLVSRTQHTSSTDVCESDFPKVIFNFTKGPSLTNGGNAMKSHFINLPLNF